MTAHTALLSFVVCATLPMAVAAAQLPTPIPREKEPPSQQTRMQEKRLSLTVYGCVRGKRLVLSPRSEREGLVNLLNANELQLEGPKELLTQLRREHEHHDDDRCARLVHVWNLADDEKCCDQHCRADKKNQPFPPP